MLPDNVFEVTISDVSITNVGFAIFLKPTNADLSRVVPIFIGPLETYSISSALDGISPPRPNTHDLLVTTLKELDSKILHVVINDIIGNIFYGRIVIQSEDGIVELDARPSDSVALAIRVKCPIYLNEKVYQEAAVQIGDEAEQSEKLETTTAPEPRSELEKLKAQLEKAVEIEDFEQAARIRDQINSMVREN